MIFGIINLINFDGGYFMKLSKKIISVILCVVMFFTMSAVAITAYAEDDVTPVVFIPGIGQSQTYKYDDDGNEVASWNMLHVNTDFASYSIFDWVKMLRLVAGLVTTIIVQRDVVSESTVKGALEVLFVDHLRNDDGTFVNNVVTPNYPCPISGYNEDARSIFDRRIPCQALVDEIGEDNVYCYNYSIFSNTFENAEGLNDYIEEVVLPQTGSDKVILVPMSMGASVVNNYLNLYPDSGRIEKIISVVGAWQGSDVFADLMLADFDENAPDMVYTDAIQQIGVDAMTGSLINIAVRILPKQEVDNLLYDIISAFVKTLIVPNTSLISLCPPDRYEEFADRYLQGEELAATKAQTDSYAKAQRELKERLEYQQEKYGTELYFIAGYNLGFGGGSGDFGFFKFFETQDTTNSDEVIEISSTAPGTTYVPAGTTFSDEYIADPSHHVSPDGSIDTSTAYFEKTTWYFNKQYHELTENNIALNLAYDIAMNKVKSIDDCKDKYPQFNNVRNLKKLNRYLDDAEQVFKLNVLSAEDDAALKKAVADANVVIANTIIDTETDNKTTENMRSIMAEIVAEYDLATDEVKEQLNYDGLMRDDYKPESEPDKTTVVLTSVLGVTAKILTLIFGKKGFGDFWSFIF